RGRRAVTGDVRGLGRDLLQHLRAHVLIRVLQLDLLGDGDAVLGDRGAAKLLVDDDVAPLRAQRRLHSLGHDVDALEERAPGLLVEFQLLRHGSGSSLLENGEDVFLAQDEIFLVVDLDLGARVLPEQDLVAGLHVEGDLLAVLANLTVADGDDLGFLRLLLGGVGNDDPALFDLFLLEPLDGDAVMQRTNLQGVSASFVLCWCRAGCLAVGLAIPSPREPFSTQVRRVLMYRGPKSRASGKIRKRKSMSKSVLVSNVLPAEALALIPNEIAVDYHTSQDA